jgi:hypothetical protein
MAQARGVELPWPVDLDMPEVEGQVLREIFS